jgi:hydroxymethylbilane synthase
MRPDLAIEPIRGNVDTRLRKLEDLKLDGVILAAAGLKRLSLAQRIGYIFGVDELTPAVGQGALAIETREEDRKTRELLAPLDDRQTHECVLAERLFLDRMGGGCQVPMGAYAWFEGGRAHFTAFVGRPSTAELLRFSDSIESTGLAETAERSADDLLGRGGRQMLEEMVNE